MADLVVPEGWEWKLSDVTCGACGTVSQVHEQPPEWLDTPEGVKWECSACGAANQLGGREPVPVLDEAVECGECHRTFDNREGGETVQIDEDGSFTCPGCGTLNRVAAGGETVRTQQAGATT